MTGISGSDDASAEAQELDQQIAELARSLDEISSGLADAGALDSEERAAALTNREEIEGVLDGLRRRREALRDRTD